MAIPTSINYMMKIDWKLNMPVLEYFRRFIPLSYTPAQTISLIKELNYDTVVFCSLETKQLQEVEKWLTKTMSSEQSKEEIISSIDSLSARHRNELQEINCYLMTNHMYEITSFELQNYLVMQLHTNLINKFAIIKQFQIKNTVDLMLSELKTNREKAEWFTKIIRTDRVKEKVEKHYSAAIDGKLNMKRQ
jgi:hypothetical protein